MNLTQAAAASLCALIPLAAHAAETKLTLPSYGHTYAQPAGDAAPTQPASDQSAPATPSASTEHAQAALPSARPGFGDPGWWGITVTTGYATDLGDIHLFNLASVAVGTFVARDLQLYLEGGGWLADQDGHTTGGGSLELGARWHFWHTSDYDWTVYADGGLGFMYSAESIPQDGSDFNFTPRAGAGFTKSLGDSSRSPRLDVGVRWFHMSNARLWGDDKNPSFDSVMIYAGVTFSL